MKDFRTVFTFYLIKQLRSKVFLILTLLLCVISAGSVIIIDMFYVEPEKDKLYIVDHTEELAGVLNQDNFPEESMENFMLDFSLIDSKESNDGLVKMARDDDMSIAVFNKEDGKYNLKVYDKGKISYTDISLFQSKMKQIIQRNRIGKLNISEGLLEEINPAIDIEVIDPSELPENYIILFLLFLLMVVFIILYSNSSSNEIAYLKTNRVMEIFSTSVNPLSLYFGVNIASGLIPLIQLSMTIISVYITKIVLNIDFGEISAADNINFTTPGFNTLLVYIILFVLGYFLYSFINTAVVSIISKTEDITSISVPIAFVGLSQYFIGIIASMGDSPLTQVFSFFPLTSPAVMFVRYTFGFAGPGQVLTSMLILVLTISFVGILGARLFSYGMSYYGNLKDFSFKLNRHKVNEV